MAQDTKEDAPSAIGRIFASAARLATSSVGLVTAYLGAITAVGIAWQKLPEPIASLPPWIRAIIVFLLPALLLIFHGIPALREQRLKKQLTQITGDLQTGYFSLRPREDAKSFVRADGEHQQILQWIEQRRGLVYLTGVSGTGKSSLLNAWVLPHLVDARQAHVIRLRGYQNPLAALQRELLRPGVIWQKPSSEVREAPLLLGRACRHISPRRLVIVFDQFEEFVIVHNPETQQQFVRFLAFLCDNPLEELTLLLVLRSDYIGLTERLGLPLLFQDGNWKEVPPFTERAAREFIQASGLKVNERLLQEVLREAAELDHTRGIVRPITINLCGLVLGRFATGLQGGFRPGALVAAFLRESILLPELQDTAPKIIAQLITNHVAKQPRTITELAQNTALNSTAILGCLRRLGQSDRSLVRPLDTKQELWEISHDFLVPLLDSIVARWRVSFWKRVRDWLPWITAASLVLAVVLISNWKRDPVAELTDLGWTVKRTTKGFELGVPGIPPKGSLEALQRIPQALSMEVDTVDASISEWRVLKNLTTLEISSEYLGQCLIVPEASDRIDLGPLQDLRSLTALRLTGRPVRDVRPLKELTNLTYLNLTCTGLTDVKPLLEMKSLTELYLGYTGVTDLRPLKELKNLVALSLRGTKVSDVEPLQELRGLDWLDLGGTEVSDVRPLKGVRSLRVLNLENTKVSDVRPLKELKGLTELSLKGAKVTDVSVRELKNNLPKLNVDR